MHERFDTFAPPPPRRPEPELHGSAVGPEDPADAGELDAHAAAALLNEAARHAERQFDRRPPLLMLIGSVLFPVAFGAIWWSVRDQHPYAGPAGWALAVLYAVVVVWVVSLTTVLRRAGQGIGGRSQARQRIEGVAFGAAWVVVYVFQGALEHAGASNAIVYGIYPATAPFIIVGSAAAAHAAAREKRRDVGISVSVVALGAGAAFAGPATVWLVVGLGLGALLLGYGTAKMLHRHAAAVSA